MRRVIYCPTEDRLPETNSLAKSSRLPVNVGDFEQSIDLDFDRNIVQVLEIPEMKDIYVIAEIGINHNGDIAIARKLMDVAKNAGCNAVKFQKRTINIVYSNDELAKERVNFLIWAKAYLNLLLSSVWGWKTWPKKLKLIRTR